MKVFLIASLITSIFCLQCGYVFAQEKEKADTSKLDIMDWFTATFSFEKPDNDFVIMEDRFGFQNEKAQLKIVCMGIPVSLERFKKDLNKDTVLNLIDTTTRIVDGKTHFIYTYKMKSPDDKFEDVEIVNITSDTGKMLAIVTGIYPISARSKYREKFIKSGMTVQRTN